MDFLNGNLVRLRALEPEDLELLYEIENDSESWFVSNFTVPYSRTFLNDYIANSMNDIFCDKQLRLIVEEIESGRAIGAIDLFDFQPMHGRAELGISIKKQYREKGYARQATELLCEYAFNFLHLKQVYVHIRAHHKHTILLYQSMGFEVAGVLKEWWRIGGIYEDVLVLQRIRPD